MSDHPISELFVAFTDWMLASGFKDASKGPQPWRGELKTDDDTLKLAFNASGEEVAAEGTHIPMYSLLIASTTYLGCAIVNPYGGMLGGLSEDKLISAFKAATPPRDLP